MRSILATGRFSTSIAGAVVLLVISVTFFAVFDLSVALGSSSGLPIINIGQEISATPDTEEPPVEQDLSVPTTIAGVSVARQDSSSGKERSSVTEPAVEAEGSQVSAVTGSTSREYVEEEVQVRGRRPDPKTEHPGRGVGLTKKPKP